MTENPLAMSDDEFNKLTEPTETEPTANTNKVEPQENTKNTNDVDSSGSNLEDNTTNTEPINTDDTSNKEDIKVTEPVVKKDKPTNKTSGIDSALNYDPENNDNFKNFDTIKTTKSEEADKNNQPIDYKAFYDKVMSPLKANGKIVKLRSPEEAITLMQKGAGYTKRMQEMAPYRKAVAMLEKANLLDEDQLSFLIDIHNKNPEAIRKLLKDSNIDSLDLELDDNAKEYVPGKNKVSDSEIQFQEAINEVLDLPNGGNTIQTCNSWDAQSKVLLGQNPQILKLLHEQMNNGIYQQVTDEVNRLISLGQIPSNIPFLQAYKIVGDNMVNNQQITPRSPQAKTKPIATSVGSKAKNTLNNNYKAKQASITRTNPTAPRVFKNPLAMSDEEFLKTFGRR